MYCTRHLGGSLRWLVEFYWQVIKDNPGATENWDVEFLLDLASSTYETIVLWKIIRETYTRIVTSWKFVWKFDTIAILSFCKTNYWKCLWWHFFSFLSHFLHPPPPSLLEMGRHVEVIIYFLPGWMSENMRGHVILFKFPLSFPTVTLLRNFVRNFRSLWSYK